MKAADSEYNIARVLTLVLPVSLPSGLVACAGIWGQQEQEEHAWPHLHFCLDFFQFQSQ